jgi:hypothetical protein
MDIPHVRDILMHRCGSTVDEVLDLVLLPTVTAATSPQEVVYPWTW